MEMENTLLRIEETVAYKYLSAEPESIQQYAAYCEKYGQNNPNRKVSSYNILIDKLEENEYSPKDGVIIINQYGILFDGQHRISILQKKYGKQYEVMVLKLEVDYTIKRKLLLLLKWIRMKLRHE